MFGVLYVHAALGRQRKAAQLKAKLDNWDLFAGIPNFLNNGNSGSSDCISGEGGKRGLKTDFP